MSDTVQEFSFRTRAKCLERFQNEVFDLLVIGGGITGAAVARDASSRGLNVALVEREDFAFGTSSRSSKLIHGGLRYLENFEFGLVFEALKERTFLLKTVPHLVRPLPFFWPVYEGDPNGRTLLSCGLWLYDLLAMFRSPGFHRGLSRDEFLKAMPFLKSDGLKGGFRYFDASMWDDVLAVETIRSAHEEGAAVANYIEAVEPLWTGERITGFKVRDLESSKEWNLHSHRTIVCAGPWTDQVGATLDSKWQRWLTPSKGVHLVFDLKRIPMPGAMVMNHPEDGRVAFVIPRPDLGAGVVIVGTTDGPAQQDPEKVTVERQEVEYLLDLLGRYFPGLNLTASDILSAYVGVRPLMGGETSGNQTTSSVLQKVSREHHIDVGPGGTVVVAGGKYTTHRKMAEEIVDFTLKRWKQDCRKFQDLGFPKKIGPSQTRVPVNPRATLAAVKECQEEATSKGWELPQELLNRYGADALDVFGLKQRPSSSSDSNGLSDPPGFPLLEEQLRYAIRNEMALHLEDFYLRRVPLYASRADHGLPWVETLARVWAQETSRDEGQLQIELKRLRHKLDLRSAWKAAL